MDLEGYRSGEPDALADVVDRAGPWVWALARRGFLCVDAMTLGAERTPLRVLGVPTPDVAAELTERILAAVFEPSRRAEPSSPGEIDLAILDEARIQLFRSAERGGRLVSVVEPEARARIPAEVEDLDALIARREAPDLDALPLSKREATRAERARIALEPFLASLDARSLRVLELRFREGRSSRSIADELDCGHAAIVAHEARLRRKARSRVRAALGDARVGDAEVDALLAGRELALLPPAPTWDRVRHGVLTRTFREEPAPFRRRLAWGVGALAIGVTGWTLMFTGVLPSSEDDRFPSPRVELRCKPACLPGAGAHVAVLAPRGASRFGVLLLRPGGEVEKLLTAPDGGTLRLPFGARARLLPAPHPVRLPGDLPAGTVAVAVFSDEPLTEAELLDYAAGRASDYGVLTATVSALR